MSYILTKVLVVGSQHFHVPCDLWKFNIENYCVWELRGEESVRKTLWQRVIEKSNPWHEYRFHRNRLT